MKATPVHGLLLMTLAAFLFSIMAALAKYATSMYPSSEVVFFRSLFATVLLLGIHRFARAKGSIWGHHRSLLVLRGVFGSCALLLFFFSLTKLAVADSILLNQCAPLFVLFLAVPFLGEPIQKTQLVLAPVTLFGVVLIISPEFDVIHWEGLAALGSACFAAGAYICIRKITRQEQAHVVVFYFSVIGMLVSAPLMLKGFQWPSGWDWLILFGIAVVAVLAQLLMTAAFRYDLVGRVAMAGYMGPLFAAVWDVLYWQQVPGWSKVLGACLIIGSLFGLQRLKPKVGDLRL